MIANKLKPGDEVRVIAPSRNLTEVRQDVHHHAVDFWEKEGFRLTFSRNSRETNHLHSSSIVSRVEDIHEAFSDPNVKMIITCLGGFNANQLLRYLDHDLIAKNPKILCGFSDITALINAIYARTGLVTYHGPHYGTFAFEREAEYGEETVYNYVHPNNHRMIGFLRKRGYTVLNLVEIRKPYQGEKLTQTITVGEHEFDY